MKRYDFKLYNQKGQETIYSPYSWDWDEKLELKSVFQSTTFELGPFGSSDWEGRKLSLDLSLIQVIRRSLSPVALSWSMGQRQSPLSDTTIGRSTSRLPLLCDSEVWRTRLPMWGSWTMFLWHPIFPTGYIPQMDYGIHHGGAGIFLPVYHLWSCTDSPHDYDQYDYAVRG